MEDLEQFVKTASKKEFFEYMKNNTDIVKRVCELNFYGDWKLRNFEIMKVYLKKTELNYTDNDIANKFNISSTRVGQISRKVFNYTKKYIINFKTELNEQKKKEEKLNNPDSLENIKHLFSTRTWNCLERNGFISISDLKASKTKELLEMRNFGEKSLKEVKKVLRKFK